MGDRVRVRKVYEVEISGHVEVEAESEEQAEEMAMREVYDPGNFTFNVSGKGCAMDVEDDEDGEADHG
jgi:hypothetical protein